MPKAITGDRSTGKVNIFKKGASPIYFDFVYEMYARGMFVGDENIKQLKSLKYLTADFRKFTKKQETDYKKKTFRRKEANGGYTVIRPVIGFKTPEQQELDKNIIIIDNTRNHDISETQLRDAIIANENEHIGIKNEQKSLVYAMEIAKEVVEEYKQSGNIIFDGGEIDFKWRPTEQELDIPSREFWEWINSINSGFQNRIGYSKYNIYRQQYQQWMEEKDDITGYSTIEGKKAYAKKLIGRFRNNSLYYLDKIHAYRKKGTTTGFSRYISLDAQKIFAFLIDSEYNLEIGKARQIWFTTTAFGIALCKTLYNKSFQAILVTSDGSKAEKTFNEKCKEPYYNIPYYLKPKKLAEDTKTTIGFHKKRHEQEGGGSLIAILPPSDTVFNAYSPNLAFVDEQGLIDCIDGMIGNWEPTMKQYSHELNKRVRAGQICLWGTSDVKNNPAFQHVFMNYYNRWMEMDFSGRMVPLFLNVFARAGMTEKEYQEEYDKAYRTQGVKRDDAIRMFHQSYPKVIEDMWMNTADTIIPLTEINRHIERCNMVKADNMCKYGYMTPILDSAQKRTDDVGYKIVGANFVQTNDAADPRNTVFIYRDPEKFWKHRYYKGTDPIAGMQGTSDFATAIWDEELHTVCAGMAWRSTNHKYVFLQSLLLGLWYDPMIPELVEINVGQNYFDYCDDKGFGRLFIPNTALHPEFQSDVTIGIRKSRGNIPQHLASNLFLMLDQYAGNIWTPKLFTQLRTYVKKEVKNPSSGSIDIYKVDDARFNKDDFIDACNYAFLCANGTYIYKKPKFIQATEMKKRKFRYEFDENYNMVMNPYYK
jgi:hypothetical protein